MKSSGRLHHFHVKKITRFETRLVHYYEIQTVRSKHCA
jgi:hypothetical protein